MDNINQRKLMKIMLLLVLLSLVVTGISLQCMENSNKRSVMYSRRIFKVPACSQNQFYLPVGERVKIEFTQLLEPTGFIAEVHRVDVDLLMAGTRLTCNPVNGTSNQCFFTSSRETDYIFNVYPDVPNFRQAYSIKITHTTTNQIFYDVQSLFSFSDKKISFTFYNNTSEDERIMLINFEADWKLVVLPYINDTYLNTADQSVLEIDNGQNSRAFLSSQLSLGQAYYIGVIVRNSTTTVPLSWNEQLFENVCECKNGFHFNEDQTLCLKNCSSTIFPGSTGQPDSDTNFSSCICEEKFQWYEPQAPEESEGCIRDCNMSMYAVQLKNGSTDECDCIQNFFWNETECIPNCTTDNFPNSIGVNDNITDQCLCEEYFFWNETELGCFIDCSSLPHGIEATSNDSSQCLCDKAYEFNATLNRCVILCDMNFSEGRPEGVEDECFCAEEFIWNATELLCVRNCSNELFEFSSGSANLSDVAMCLCQADFQWAEVEGNSSSANCRRVCENISYSSGRNFSVLDECLCESSFEWVANETQCGVICQELNHSLSRNPDALDLCLCEEGYEFNSTQINCVITCNMEFATGRNPGDEDICQCQQSLYWNQSVKSCYRNCSNESNALATSEETPNTCTCEQGFQWDEIQVQCVILCQMEFSLSRVDNSSDECLCKPLAKWNSSTMVCDLLCTMEYVDKDSLEHTNSSCACLEGFVWNDAELRCELDCGSIDQAISLQEGSIDACICEKTYKWDAQQTACRQSRQSRAAVMAAVFAPIIAIAGVSVVSVVAGGGAGGAAGAAGGVASQSVGQLALGDL